MDRELIATQCMFVKHIPKTATNDDTHLVTLKHHYNNGDVEKVIKIFTDYKRPIWVTKPIYRKHKQKKEYESIDKLDKIRVTQSDMNIALCRALNKEPSQFNIRMIKDSPYIYGYDIPSISFIKELYDIKNDNFFKSYDVLNLDIEFDVTGKYNDISIITMSKPGHRHTYALRRLYKNIGDDAYVIDLIKRRSLLELPDSTAKKICTKYDVTLYDNDLDMLKDVFNMLHTIKPDIVTFHNMVYDLTKIIERLRIYEYPAEDLFSDPTIPQHLRRLKLNPAKTSKEKKGKKYSIPIEDQWTTLESTASFMVMDSMTGYSAVRQGAGKLVGGYGLDNILNKNKIHGKMIYVDENTTNISKLAWHQYMSEHKPIEYTLYAEQDTLGMTDLELKNKDFSYAVPIFIGIGDFNRFNSSVHKNVCTGYQDHLEHGLIIGTTPTTPIDWSILGTNDWIKTLSADNIQEIGLEITNIPGLKTNVTAHADDVDCVSSYPSDTEACNVSHSTCISEIISVGDLDKTEFKNNNINLVSSNANNLDYMTKVLKAPTVMEMIKLAKKELAM